MQENEEMEPALPHTAHEVNEIQHAVIKKKFRFWTRNAIIASVVAHVLFGIGAAFIVAIRSYHKPQSTFRADPLPRPRLEARKLEKRVKIQDLQKASARPQLQPRLAAMSPSDIALPEIKKKPRKAEKKIQRKYSVTAVSGFGSGIGGGFGSGAGGGGGGNITFFGLQAAGRHIAFCVDFSASMRPEQLELLKQELTKSLKELNSGMMYQVICFAGPVWFLGDEVSNNRNNPTVKSGGKKYEWKTRGGATAFYYPGGHEKLAQGPWLAASASQKKKTVKAVEETTRKDMVWGTTWEWPLKQAMNMKPKPDVIYFMTDGNAGNIEQTVEVITKLNKKSRPPAVIHTVGMMTNATGSKGLKALAKDNKGKFTEAQASKKTAAKKKK